MIKSQANYMKDYSINELKLIDETSQTDFEREQFIKYCLKYTFYTCLVLIITISVIITSFVNSIISEIPDAKILINYTPDQSTLIYDKDDNLIANMNGDQDRVSVKLDKVSPHFKNAVIAIEDNRFYDHNGVDLIGIFRALVMNITSGNGKLQGGSTLTQQLVKNSFLTQKKSMQRKLAEAILAVRVERVLTKQDIFEKYLNQIYLGNMSYGIEKAARRYFKKHSNELTLAESSMLAGLIKAPEGFSPYKHYKKARSRQGIVLDRMEHYGFITKDQKLEALKEKIVYQPRKTRYSKYSYYISHVSYLLRQRYGNDVVRRGGLRVYTTLNPEIQELAEFTVQKGVERARHSGAKQGALVTIEAKTGYVQAIVGGIDFAASNFNRATQSRRAPGSSFKPVVYLTAFRLGLLNPDSPITDAPITLSTGWSSWSPKNWDGRFMGKMNVRKALYLSRNTPTVRVGLKVGIENIIKTARMLGIRNFINKNFSIVLGSFGISPLEMATVFSCFSREGTYIEPVVIRRVEDIKGNILEQADNSPVQVVDSEYVRDLNSILLDVVDKGTGKRARLEGRQVGGKTGTTDNIRDVWFTGFTPDMVTSIWLGNDRNRGMHGVYSSTCAQLWGEFAKDYYKINNIPPSKFNISQRMAQKKYGNKSKKSAKR